MVHLHNKMVDTVVPFNIIITKMGKTILLSRVSTEKLMCSVTGIIESHRYKQFTTDYIKST
jgi:hypothetical protein